MKKAWKIIDLIQRSTVAQYTNEGDMAEMKGQGTQVFADHFLRFSSRRKAF